jgi:hypothetical protein
LNEPAENQDLIAFPEWTEYRKKNGLDELCPKVGDGLK